VVVVTVLAVLVGIALVRFVRARKPAEPVAWHVARAIAAEMFDDGGKRLAIGLAGIALGLQVGALWCSALSGLLAVQATSQIFAAHRMLRRLVGDDPVESFAVMRGSILEIGRVRLAIPTKIYERAAAAPAPLPASTLSPKRRASRSACR
jgi:hypothetical protein